VEGGGIAAGGGGSAPEVLLCRQEHNCAVRRGGVFHPKVFGGKNPLARDGPGGIERVWALHTTRGAAVFARLRGTMGCGGGKLLLKDIYQIAVFEPAVAVGSVRATAEGGVVGEPTATVSKIN